MSRVLIASTPIHGHLAPLLSVANALVERSHEVRVLTGQRFGAAVEAVGAGHVPLPAGADFDDRDLDLAFPARRSLGRIAKANFDIARMLADPLPHQVWALDELQTTWRPDVVLVDSSFLGAMAWRVAGDDGLPPLAVANVSFLAVSGSGVPPPGVGLVRRVGVAGRVRDAAVATVTDRLLIRSGLSRLKAACEQAVGRSLPALLWDGPLVADRLLVLTVPSFEYPRPDLPERVRFVGPVRPVPAHDVQPPPWWSDLETGRPVVHVTQGTFDNADQARLIGPTLAALADEPVLVVAATGGPASTSLPGPIPANARLADFVPYEHLLPRVDVMVTNGGYGGVQSALAHGVPLVVAGDGEDKPEIAARVAWTGAGIDLRTGRPRIDAIRRAVAQVRHEPAHRQRARALQVEMAGFDGATGAADAVEELMA